jgi:hypothetical protein
MRSWRHGLMLLLLLANAGAAFAVPLLAGAERSLPPVVEDTTKPKRCTVAFLIQDVSTNDLYGVRMEVESNEDVQPVNGIMPCPRIIPPRVGVRALDACTSRAVEARSCVYADMSRGFELEPDARNTAENQSRCNSDRSTHIGVACWRANRLEVCNVACGTSAEDAAAQARERCETKQEKPCPITGAMSILTP